VTQRNQLTTFFAENRQMLVAYVRSRIRETVDQGGEDIVQDVMLAVLERPLVTGPILNISAYVLRALRNRIVDLYRGQRREPIALDLLKDSDGGFPEAAANTACPVHSHHNRTRMELLLGLIRELPRQQMEVIVETEFNGRSFRELSEEWSIPLGTLLARKHRGIRTLRKRLEELEEE